MPASIRRAETWDAAALAQLGEATFRETFLEDFAIPYPGADLAPFMAAHQSETAFAAMLADPAQAVWIAEAADTAEREAIGYACVGLCALPHPDVRPGDGELKRLYLRRAAQGRGAGTGLLLAALAWLEREGPRPIWIGVWSGNLKAQRLYARHGFAKVGEYEFPVGRWRDHEFIFRRGEVQIDAAAAGSGDQPSDAYARADLRRELLTSR